jgi:hypothetical protein
VANTEWTYALSPTKAGGLVLNDVRHFNHNFASDVRITRVYVGTATGAPIYPGVTIQNKRALVLGSADLPYSDTQQAVRLPTKLGLIAPFATPQIEYAHFKTPGPALADGQTAPLEVEQRYLFTSYGVDPPHEPGAIAWGARFYPLLSFSYPKSPTGAPPVNYFRADLRMAVGIEQVNNLQNKGKQVSPLNVTLGSDLVNQAGLFKDGSSITPRLEALFDRIEKPLHYEILSMGNDWDDYPGLNGYWDNIHQWPAAEGLAATPGANHAGHFHWRWGVGAAVIPKSIILRKLVAPATGPQFEGFLGPITPLIDPRIPFQRLTFAITKYEATDKDDQAWAPEKNPSTDIFSDLFIKNRAVPKKIEKGKPLVWWMSVEVFRSPLLTGPWQGTLFAHGSFFTHSSISLFTKTQFAVAGLYGASDKGSFNSPEWWRPERPRAKV